MIHLGPDDVELTSRLIRFGECDELLDYIHTEYAERVGPWGFEDGTPWAIFADRSRMDDMAMADEMEDSADGFASVPTAGADEANAKSLTEGVDYSGTNVQEAGVDEADIIKTDGNRIFTLSEGLLVVTGHSQPSCRRLGRGRRRLVGGTVDQRRRPAADQTLLLMG